MFSARFQHPSRICVRGYRVSLEATLLQKLLEATRTHDDEKHHTEIFRGVDKALREVASGVRAELAKYIESEEVCFEGKMAKALLEGRKTVARWPVETTLEGELLPAPFEVGGGHGGSYALQELAEDGSSINLIHDYRLKVVGVEMETAEMLHLDEVHAEGFESRLAHTHYWCKVFLKNEDLVRWIRSHGLLVWRYEIELLEL